MSFDYTTVAGDAVDMLTDFGQVITQRTFTEAAYDTTTSTATPSTSDVSRIGVKLDFAQGQTQERGTLIAAGDFRLLLDPVSDVSMQDVFIIAGVQYKIVSIGEVNPAGVRCLYDIHIRT